MTRIVFRLKIHFEIGETGTTPINFRLFLSFISIYITIPGVPEKMYLTLTVNFEVVTTLMSRILVFPVFRHQYNLFDNFLICFHDLMNK